MMKKFLSFLVLVLVSVFLVSCGEPKKKEIQLSNQEVATMASAVSVSVDGKDVISLESNIDLKVVLKGAEDSEVGDIELIAKGEVAMYADLDEFSSSYIYVKVDAKYEINGNLEGFIFSLMGIDESELTEEDKANFLAMMNLDFPRNASVVGKVYVIAGVAYVDATIITDGVELKVKRYEEVFSEEEFNEWKEELDSEKIEISEMDIEELLEVANLKTYKVGDANLFEISLTKEKFEEAILAAIEEAGDYDAPVPDFTITHNGPFDAKLSVKFQETIEEVKAAAKMNLGIEFAMDMGGGMNLEQKILVTNDFTFELNFKGKMPKGLPKAEDMKDYAYGLDFDFLPDSRVR
ncbi:MAG TPA: hypothetical protein PKZ13_02075 [Bacilli bacterium]|nr:hypothetical protein [Bacilli bacterium]